MVRTFAVDVLALDAVAARGGTHEAAARVGDRHRQPVDLQLADVAAHGADGALDPNAEITNLIRAEGIVETEHRGAVPDLGEARRGLAAYSLGGGVGGLQLGKRRLEVDELAEEVVVVRVGDLGCVEDVVQARVTVELLRSASTRSRAFSGVTESELFVSMPGHGSVIGQSVASATARS